LVVHHRDRRNEVKLLVTLCAGCHMRLHHSYGFRHWLSGTLLGLWRELHQCDPVQLQLSLENVAKGNTSATLTKARIPVSSKSGMVMGAIDNSTS
jgi:hypothetical protein